jgi:hypothetical protein
LNFNWILGGNHIHIGLSSTWGEGFLDSELWGISVKICIKS